VPAGLTFLGTNADAETGRVRLRRRRCSLGCSWSDVFSRAWLWLSLFAEHRSR